MVCLKEIGEKLKEARESIGVTIEEAAEDLKIKPEQVIAIEEGKMEAFQDVSSLKYFIRDYSKYLGLDYSDMVDDFNEYLFDYTSKISLEDIKKAKKKLNDKKETKIHSPYTMEYKEKKNPITILIIIFSIVLVLLIAYLVYISIKDHKKTTPEPVVANVIR